MSLGIGVSRQEESNLVLSYGYTGYAVDGNASWDVSDSSQSYAQAKAHATECWQNDTRISAPK